MPVRKTDEANIRERYPIYVEIGLIIALGVVITAFKVHYDADSDFQAVVQKQETVELKKVQQTRQQKQPPPPPRPPVPVEVPNDQVLENQNLNFDASLDLSESLQPTTPPPEPDKEKKKKEPEIFLAVQQMPEPVGGIKAIHQAINYPDFARRAGIEGTVFVRFTVNEQGNTVNVVIVRGVHELLNKEAVRVIKQAKFTVGKQRGEPVKVRMSMPITFQLQ